jgi:hypothetical protein
MLPAMTAAATPGAIDGSSALVEVVSDGSIDTDGDGLLDSVELVFGTDPAWSDTDGDAFPDGYELWSGLDPLDPLDGAADADGDGLSNLEEYRLGTSPFVTDTDGDRFWDGIEVKRGTDPLQSWSFPTPARRADVNCDGQVNAIDVQMVMNGVLGMNVPVPVNIDYVSNLNATDVQLVVNAAIGRR